MLHILFIVDETVLFLPTWLDGVINKMNPHYQIIAITPLRTTSKTTWETYLKKYIWLLGFSPIVKLLISYLQLQMTRLLYEVRLYSKPVTIAQVAQKHHIKIIETNDVNSIKYLTKITQLQPDLIISSCSQIFKKKLLKLPKVACINRHSSLLPSYGGVLPVFWAMINREKNIGVTIHYMIEKIDAGKILYQKAIPIVQSDTLLSLYKKAYAESITVTIEALEIIRNKKKTVVLKKIKSSYFTFPTKLEFKHFFKTGNRFV